VEKHDILIEFEGKDAIITSSGYNYEPEFLATDPENTIYYLDSLREDKPTGYIPRMINADESGNVYFMFSPTRNSDENSSEIVNMLRKHDESFRNYYESHFKKFSLFLGYEGDSMVPARLIGPTELTQAPGVFKFNFKWDEKIGILLFPKIPEIQPMAMIKESWNFERRLLDEIIIKEMRTPCTIPTES
jgi:hypothetical protein